MSLVHAAAQAAWVSSCLPGWHRFRRALAHPKETQQRILAGILSRHADTGFGKEHGFHQLQSVDDFRGRVPARTWEELDPWLEQARQGVANVLTPPTRQGNIAIFEPSSGTTSATKLVPCNKALMGEFQNAISPWMFDLYTSRPQLLGGPSYWSVSPITAGEERTAGGTPIGFEEDAAYLGGVRAALVREVLCVPAQVKTITDPVDFRYITLLNLLATPELRLVSVWSPSFFSVLLADLSPNWDSLLHDLAHGTATPQGSTPADKLGLLAPPRSPRRSSMLRELGPKNPGLVWPELDLISCWTDAGAAAHVAQVQAQFPGVHIQPKGLLATEAVVSVPFENAHPLAITSHFFEFQLADGRVVGAEELRVGDEAEVIVTTSGGLMRYRLGDRVRVEQHLAATPSIRFLGKSDKTSDICGEKLHEAFIENILEAIWTHHEPRPSFAMLAPDSSEGAPGYTLFISGSPKGIQLADQLERRLQQNFHYELAIRIGQLKKSRVFCITEDAWPAFYKGCQDQGQRMGDVKPSVLDLRSDWSTHFQGHYVSGTHP